MGATPVTTRSFDNMRSNAMLQETKLTQALIKQYGLRMRYTLYLDGDGRGTEAQVLIAPAIRCSDGITHDLVLVVTMANNVYAFDKATHETIWMRRIANPILGTRKMDMFLINDKWGILSTPVLDLDTQRLWCVSMSSPTGQFSDSSHHLHSINLVDGREASPAFRLSDVTYQPPNGLPVQKMGAVARKQRAALALSNRDGRKTIFVANGSFLESAITNQGWLVAIDITTGIPKFGAAITTTARLSGAGIWMGSGGPAVDPKTGDVMLTTGNGSFDGITDFGESCVRYKYTPPGDSSPGSLTVVSYQTPFTDAGRVAGQQYQTLAAVSLLPDNPDDDPNANTSNMDAPDDSDLNSGGPLLVTKEMTGYDKDVVIFCGKDGIGYVVDFNNMGNQTLQSFDPKNIQSQVYDTFLYICWLTYYPGPNVSCTPTDLIQIPTIWGDRTHHMHATPVFYNSSKWGPMIFVMGENGNVRAWQLTKDYKLKYLACSVDYASPRAKVPPGGMPGGLLTLSANGSVAGSALLFACIPWGDANRSITDGHFCVFDPENFIKYNDGSSGIVKLWDSADWNITYKHCKFNIATINEDVYVPTYDARVLVLSCGP